VTEAIKRNNDARRQNMGKDLKGAEGKHGKSTRINYILFQMSCR
jgi:hypothetical protein